MVCQTSEGTEESQANLAADTHSTNFDPTLESLGMSEQTCEEESNEMGECLLPPKPGSV